MTRIMLVSSDSHAAAPSLASYRPYLEAKFHQGLDEHIAAEQALLERYEQLFAAEEAAIDAVDDQCAIRSGGRLGTHDPKRRIEEMDREGVVAEVVTGAAGDGLTFCIPPFCSIHSAPWPAEFRDAGARAFNRWLADMMSETDGRVLGVAEIGSCMDMDAQIEHLEWVADHGFVSLLVPGRLSDPALPRLFDRTYYERLWAACVDLDLGLYVHAGSGTPQIDLLHTLLPDGAAAGFDMDEYVSSSNRLIHEKLKLTSNFISQLTASEGAFTGGLSLQSREPLWQLMIGGAFDRHPKLKLSVTELRADWLPVTLAVLDGYVAGADTPLKLKPSEYFTRNCRVTPSFTHPVELGMRRAIGVEQMMFARDYPHPEGTWPNTWDWIRGAFAGVPEDEARLILGENAADWFGLDRAKLTQLAEKIGPRPEDILGDHAVDPRKIEHFDKRGGYSKPAESVDTDVLLRAFQADLRMANTAAS